MDKEVIGFKHIVQVLVKVQLMHMFKPIKKLFIFIDKTLIAKRNP